MQRESEKEREREGECESGEVRRVFNAFEKSGPKGNKPLRFSNKVDLLPYFSTPALQN